jgi:RloB-like protein
VARRLPPHLRRAIRPITDARPVVTVFSEGRNSEPVYLKAFARARGGGLVSVRIHPAGGVPRTLVEQAVEARRVSLRTNKGNSFAAKDEFWAAFDRDEHPNIAEARELAAARGIGVAYSNPCFEVWLLLHCIDVVVDAPLERHQAQKLLDEHVPSYSSKGGKTIKYEEIADRYEEACERAKVLRARREEEGDALGNPYTDFDQLTETIRKGPRS